MRRTILMDENQNPMGTVKNFNDIDEVTKELEEEFGEPITVEFKGGDYVVTSPSNNFDPYLIWAG